MSTKFSGHGKLHKPPAVCKTPPPASALPPKPHADQTFQGFATWNFGDGTDQETITVWLTLLPLGTGLHWAGISPEERIQLKLLMTWLSPANAHRYDLTRIENGTLTETTTIERADDRDFDPFDSGLLLFPSRIPELGAQARVNY